MSKRTKPSENQPERDLEGQAETEAVLPPGSDEVGVIEAAVDGERTSPDLADSPEATFAAAESDISWDEPTNVGSEAELAELAAASVTHVDVAPFAEAVEGPAEGVREGEADGPAEPEAEAEATVEGAEAGDLPPVAAPGRLASIIESLLFASDRPLTLNDLKRLVGERDGTKINVALEELRARREEGGVHLVQIAGGWQLRTNPENVAWVSRILSGKPPRLSRALLETLAIVAYRQPITRPEIDEVRGVDCGPVLKTLLERSLVRMIGKKEEVGRPILYGTTPEFLRTFSLRDLTELPTLREFHELGEAEKAKVDAAAPASIVPGEQAPLPRPAPVREVDPAEEDELLSELERANAAATLATAPPPEATPDAPPDLAAAGDDEKAIS